MQDSPELPSLGLIPQLIPSFSLPIRSSPSRHTHTSSFPSDFFLDSGDSEIMEVVPSEDPDPTMRQPTQSQTALDMYDDYPEPFSQSATTFECAICETTRARSRRVRVDRDVCTFCHHNTDVSQRLRFCMACQSERLESTFVDEEGNPSYICGHCRGI